MFVIQYLWKLSTLPQIIFWVNITVEIKGVLQITEILIKQIYKVYKVWYEYLNSANLSFIISSQWPFLTNYFAKVIRDSRILRSKNSTISFSVSMQSISHVIKAIFRRWVVGHRDEGKVSIDFETFIQTRNLK